MSSPLRLLHLHSSFAAGGKELRAAKLMNAFGRHAEHAVISAVPDELGAAAAIDRTVRVDYPDDFPPLSGRPGPIRLLRLAEAMQGFDLVLSYNWGAMDAVMAHMLYRSRLALPPLVHHEDGFNQDEALRLKPLRTWYRRIALRGAQAVVVPSRSLEQIALQTWMLPRANVHRIANGIRVRDYGGKARPDALPRVVKQKGELWLGALAGLRTVKNLPRLVRAFAPLPDAWQLVIVGEGPEREAIRAEALRQGVGHRVHLPGFVPDPARIMGLFDLFALSSDSEQFPISVVEAMAARLAIVAPRVGDIEWMVAAENCSHLVASNDEAALARALATLAADPALRRTVGAANRAKAEAQFDEAAMLASYRAVYAQAMGRNAFP